MIELYIDLLIISELWKRYNTVSSLKLSTYRTTTGLEKEKQETLVVNSITFPFIFSFRNTVSESIFIALNIFQFTCFLTHFSPGYFTTGEVEMYSEAACLQT